MESKRIYSEKDWNGILEKFNLSEEEINEKRILALAYINPIKMERVFCLVAN